MVLDHSISVDVHGRADALDRNLKLDVARNAERFQFVKQVAKSLPGMRLIPPGLGILHQINLEVFAPLVLSNGREYYPDSLVGTDSHTCMIAGLGVLGWGVGGIEAIGRAHV